MTITITHTQAEGTLLQGSTKGDGVLEIARRAGGFTWFPSIKAIGIRGSRDHLARERNINAAAAALRAAGHEVVVTIDNTPQDRAEVLARQAAQLDDRYAALTNKAQRIAARAADAHDQSDAIAARFEGGQRILRGHHSERRARRDRERMDALDQRANAEHRRAEQVADRASAVGSSAAYSELPAVTARRIAKHESRLRIIARDIAGHTRNHYNGRGEVFMAEVHEPAKGDHLRRLLEERADVEARLEYDRALLDKAIAEGRHVVHSKATLHVGDRVSWIRGCWYTISKVNRTTIQVQSAGDVERGYAGSKLPMIQIREVVCPHGDGGPVVIAPQPTKTRLRRARPAIAQPDPAAAARIEEARNAPDVYAPGYFPTPVGLAAQVVARAGLADAGGVTVLEPSAGDGALVRAVLAANERARVIAVEPIRDLAQRVVATGDRARVTVMCRPFEDLEAGRPQVDYVVMNPPFSAPGQPLIWADHTLAAYERVAPGGRLVAILPLSVQYRQGAAPERLRELIAECGGMEVLPDDSFASCGTKVRVVMVWLDRAPVGDAS